MSHFNEPTNLTADDKREDLDVFERAVLDEVHAARFEKPWLAQYASGTVVQFDTEDQACAFQAEHRARYNVAVAA